MLHIVSTNFMAFALLLMLQLIFIVHCTWPKQGQQRNATHCYGYCRDLPERPILIEHQRRHAAIPFGQVTAFSVMQLFNLCNFSLKISSEAN